MLIPMKNDKREIEERKTTALAAIKQSAADKAGQVALFVSHHLQELDDGYWKKHTGAPRPTQSQILDLLVLTNHWSLGGVESFDFTLPEDITNYLISVRFNKKGEITDVSMES
jgi:uncharacterized protein YfaS (alpha-2-macroglobulin family)